MPTFSFKGFSTGSMVALSAAQGAGLASGSVATWDRFEMGSVQIQSTSAVRVVAPAMVWLEATGHADLAGFVESGAEYDGAAQEYTHIWTVRGQPFDPFSAPQNMLSVWNNANVAYGRKVAMVLPDAGSHIIDLWVMDRNGVTAESSTTIVVSSADDAYPGPRTICFSNLPGETWATEKPGCLRATSITDLRSKIAAVTQPTRVLFKRGQEVSDVYLRFFEGDDIDLIADWGDGPLPYLAPEANNWMVEFDSDYSNQQLTLSNLYFRGGWDPTTETGRAERDPFRTFQKTSDTHLTLHGCTFDGFQQVQPFVNTPGGLSLIGDCVFTNWRDYGIYLNPLPSGVRLAVVGSRLTQHPEALNGGESSKNGLFNSHGPLRYGQASDAYIACSDFFSRGGWSALTPDVADQPCLRCGTEGVAGAYCMIDRIVAEGGFKVITFERQNNSLVSEPGNYILDKVLCIGTGRTPGQYVASEFGGMQVRNLLAIDPDVPSYHTTNSKKEVLAFLENGNPSPGNSTGPVAVHSSTFLSLKSAANDFGDEWDFTIDSTDFLTRIEENNVLLAESLETPVIGSQPLQSTDMPDITPRYKGVRFNFASVPITNGANIDDGQTLTIPYASVTDDIVRQTGGTPTSQAYWLAVHDTRHTILVANQFGNGRMFTADSGEFAVNFGVSEITITNLSGETWFGAFNWHLRLDRRSLLPPMDTTYESPTTLPLPRPGAGSNAIDAGDAGRRAYDDFLGHVRPGPGGVDHLGNPRPATGNERGALLQG